MSYYQENRELFLAIVGGLTLALIGVLSISGTIPFSSPASAATETISVSATISQWLSFGVSTNTIALTPELVTSAGGTNIGSSTEITLTAGTNNSSGYGIEIKDLNGGLCHSGGCGTHNITSGDATLSAGTDGYGAQATTTDTDVGTVDANYDFWGASNQQVGDLSSSPQALADTTAPSSNDQTLLKLKAAAASIDPAGTYSDTVTLTCLANP